MTILLLLLCNFLRLMAETSLARPGILSLRRQSLPRPLSRKVFRLMMELSPSRQLKTAALFLAMKVTSLERAKFQYQRRTNDQLFLWHRRE